MRRIGVFRVANLSRNQFGPSRQVWAIVVALSQAWLGVTLLASPEMGDLDRPMEPDALGLSHAAGDEPPISPTSTHSGNLWESSPPLSVPTARFDSAMAYDSQSDRMILFGGEGDPSVFPDDTWAYDFNTNTWTKMDPVSDPGGRCCGHVMAYDSQSDRVILFEGETWAYDFEANTWTDMTSPGEPSPRSGLVAYDSQSDRVILFGGETWAYDFNTNNWTNLDPVARPPALFHSMMAYDSQSDRVILFGSRDVFANLGNTWAYDFDTNTWTNMTSPGEPSSELGSRMAYDSQSDRVILFGPRDVIANLGNTWAYDFDTNTWTDMDPVRDPGGRGGPAMAYDSQSDRVILFGGWLHPTFFFNDTWAYDLNGNAWVEVTPRPISRPTNLMSYDSESDRIILVAGDAYSPYLRANSDTWAYDYDSDTWTKMHAVGPDVGPVLSGGYSIDGNAEVDVTYDSESDRVILFSPWPGTWAYDFNTNTWTNMTRPGGPANVFGSRMAYDSQSDRVVLFAGGGPFWCSSLPGRRCSNDTWAYDFNTNTWTNMTRPGGPANVFGSRMAYDSQSDRVVLFGGFYGGDIFWSPLGPCSGETWAYDFDTNTWTNMTQTSGPIGRGFSAMAYDSDHDRTILYGGGCSDQGGWRIRRDTWAYDFDTNTWTNMTPSSDPGPQRNHAMAYDVGSHVTVVVGRQVSHEPHVNTGPWWYRYPESAPSSPRTFRAVAGNQQVTLSWEAPDYDGGRPVTGYRIYRFAWPEGLSVVATVGPAFTYTDAGLTNGVLYYYWVSALNAIGDGPLSETAAVTPRLTLSAPGNLRATAGNARVLLTWQPASSGDGSRITGYRIYRGASPDSLVVVAGLWSALTYADTNVTNGVTYYYRASALVGTDEGPRSVEAIARPTESTNPMVTILSPADGTTIASTSAVISGTASDDTAILRVELSRDGINWVTATGTTSWSGNVNLDEGTNKIHARATDTSGNTANMSISVMVSNPVVGFLSSPIVIVASAIGVAAVLGAVAMQRWRDRRWERKEQGKG